MDVEMTDAPPLDGSVEIASLPILPCEIQLMICEYLADDTQSLAAFARSCKRLKEAATKVLYDNITIDNEDLARMFALQNVGEAGMISKNLKNLAREWNHAKQAASSHSHLTCKNLKLLEFPHDDSFFENATDPEYHDRIKQQVQARSKTLPEAHVLYVSKDALKHKAGIVATMHGIRTLAVDISDKEEFLKNLFITLVSQRKRQLWNTAWDIFAPEPVTVESALTSHFSSLHTLEFRCARSVSLSKDGTSQGTMTVNGSWLSFPSLKTFKYHGHAMSKDVQSTFLGNCLPTTLHLNDFACNGRHPLFTSSFQSSREEFKDCITSFSWKNMDPCSAVVDQLIELVSRQTGSLRNLSLVRRRLLVDRPRSLEKFFCGEISCSNLKALEYLDIDSRFLIETEPPKFESLLKWLGIPASLQTLSIDAITEQEVPYFKVYLEQLFSAVKSGLLSKLKSVRCGFMGMRNGKKVQGWKVLGNLPGQFLCHGVWVSGWHYDDEEEDEGDTIAARVRTRAGRRRRRAAT